MMSEEVILFIMCKATALGAISDTAAATSKATTLSIVAAADRDSTTQFFSLPTVQYMYCTMYNVHTVYTIL